MWGQWRPVLPYATASFFVDRANTAFTVAMGDGLHVDAGRRRMAGPGAVAGAFQTMKFIATPRAPSTGA